MPQHAGSHYITRQLRIIFIHTNPSPSPSPAPAQLIHSAQASRANWAWQPGMGKAASGDCGHDGSVANVQPAAARGRIKQQQREKEKEQQQKLLM